MSSAPTPTPGTQGGGIEKSAIFRIMDANANRAREGLRVVEDCVRFGCSDGHLTAKLKGIRHQLSATLADLGVAQHGWPCRDTETDVGASVETAREYERHALTDILGANLGRVGEALRSLEEMAKTLSSPLARRIESLRYEMYTWGKAAQHVFRARQRLADRLLYVLIDLQLHDSPSWEQRVKQLLSADVGILQLRDKTASDRELIQAAQQLRRWSREADTLLIINDRPDIAALVRADGVHVGQDEMACADVRQVVGPDLLIGVSTHAVDQALEAVSAGADYIGVGPVFPSSTKHFEDHVGLELVRQVTQAVELPAFAIGGIDASNASRVLGSGADRFAVSHAVWAADNPANAARGLHRTLQEQAPSVAAP